MPHPAKVFLCLLSLGLAGCATSSRRNSARAPDWESEELAAARTAPAAPAPALVPAVSGTSPPPAPVNQNSMTWVPLHRWCETNGFTPPSRLETAPVLAYSLATDRGALVFHPRSSMAQWDRLEFRLGFAPQVLDGQLCLHLLDLDKTIQPLLSAAKMNFSATNPVIVIDPGHGGEDSGAKSFLGNRYEKEFTLDWALRLAPLLASRGWQVLLTRTNDTELSLSNRVLFAEAHKADAFLSLHFNSAAPNEVEAGLETYCLTPAGMPSSVTRGFADDLSLVFPNNAFDSQNYQLALQVHRALLQVNGNHDRGVRRARFLSVLRGQQRPAILVEGGYLSNPQEARLISEPAYRQRLAEALACSLGAVAKAGPLLPNEPLQFAR